MTTILHLTTVHPRSDTRILIKEAQTLASCLTHKVLLIVADSQGNVEEKLGKVSIYDLGRLGGGRMGRVLIGSYRALFIILRIKPSIVHFHDPELIPLGMLLKLIGYTVIYDIHEDVPAQTYGKEYIPKCIRHPVALAISALEWVAAKIFDAVIPATPKIAERFPTKKTVVVQNFPISTQLFAPYSIPYEQRVQSFIYMGGIAKIRGAFEMIRAFEFLQNISGVKLEIAGEFSPSSLEGELRALPGWAKVDYHGQVSRSELVNIMGRVRAGLVLFHPLPNHIDAQPNKMFEYMSAGLPVIASDFPLWRQIIEGAGCGLLVDPLSPKAIGEALRWILDHPAEAEQMGQRGRKAVEQSYNWDAEAIKITTLYKRLLSQ